MFYRNIGHNLARLRAKQGLDQAQLAEMVGLTQSFISKVENNKVVPSLKTLEAIAGALKVDIAELMREEVKK